MPDALTGPRALRRAPASESLAFATRLLDQIDEVADDALMACAFASGPRELDLPDDLLLAWFSPAYRTAAGIPGAESPAGFPYDGPADLPQAIASPLTPDEPANLLLPPATLRRISDTLGTLTLLDGGQNEMGILYDFIEDNYTTGMELSDAVQGGPKTLQWTYGQAADYGLGVLVINGWSLSDGRIWNDPADEPPNQDRARR